jgi:hypothetical protein
MQSVLNLGTIASIECGEALKGRMMPTTKITRTLRIFLNEYTEDIPEHRAMILVVGIVRSVPYVAGTNCGWVKVKTQTWRAANRERYKLFERAS